MDMLYTFLIEPLSYDFMQRALLMSVMIGVVCAMFSCFLILKGWSLMGDAVSHAVLPGLALAYLAGLPLAVGAFVAGLLCAAATGFLRNHSRVKEDAVMGIVFSGMFALGLVLLTRIETDVHLMHVLFGNVLGISQNDMIEAIAISAFAFLAMMIWRRDIMLYCFDPSHARAIGLNVRFIHFGLLILLALTIVAALKAAGVILVIAMLIAPGATAFMVTRSFDRMMAVAVLVSVVSCITGTVASYHLDTATAPLIVVIQAGLFILALIRGRRISSVSPVP
jgi:manganese/iron transport system permease protein